MSKTEYRIFPVEIWGVIKNFLQFKDVKKVKTKKYLFFGPTKEYVVEKWCFIVTEYGYLRGASQYTDKMSLYDDHNYVYGYSFQNDDLKSFADKWRNIQDYFAILDKLKQKHDNKIEEHRKNAKIIYLNKN